MVTPKIQEGEYLTLALAGNLTGLNPWQIKRLVDKGVIQALRLPDGRRVPLKSSVEAYLAKEGKK